MSSEALDRLRSVCTDLPEVEERLSHGEPAWFVRGKKLFVMFADHHHDDRVAFWCACRPEIQAAFISDEPEKFFKPPYVGVRGWLGVYLDRPTDWNEVAGIVSEAYRLVAPKKLADQLP